MGRYMRSHKCVRYVNGTLWINGLNEIVRPQLKQIVSKRFAVTNMFCEQVCFELISNIQLG